MSERSSFWQWGIVALLVALSLFAIWPPERQLKGGIDLVGGTSLLFEIDTAGLDSAEQVGLASRVMDILKRRVDPNAQLNLVWRPIGNTRLEIQMPRPTQEALQRRQTFEAAMNLVRKMNVSRNDIENALASAEGSAEDALSKLERALDPSEVTELLEGVEDEPVGTKESVKKVLASGITGRGSLLLECKAKWEAYQQLRGGEDFEAEEKALEAYDKAVDDVLKTNLDLDFLSDALALDNSTERGKVLEDMKSRYPSYAVLVQNAIGSYDRWSSRKGLLEDPSDLKRRIRGAGVLEFRILAERDPANPDMASSNQAQYRQSISKYVTQLNERGPRWKAGESYRWIEVIDIVSFLSMKNIDEFEVRKAQSPVVTEKYAGSYYVLSHADPNMGLLKNPERPWKLEGAFASRDRDTGRPNVIFRLDGRGGSMFGELTGNNINAPMAIVLDDKAQSFATIISRIHDVGSISGRGFTQQDVVELVNTLQAGSLPARLKETPIAEKNIGPSLGERNRTMGMRAAIGGLGITIFFMWIYYRASGFVATLALGMNVLLTLAIMATLEATFTLPGIAGLILSLGMAVDANVLINERFREERERGLPLRKAVRLGYEKAFSTILDSNLTTLLTCIILGYVGSEEVKGFAMVLGFGLATSMFTAVLLTRWIIMPLIDKGVLKDIHMMKIVGVPKIDWIGMRRYFFPTSLVVCTAGVLLFATTAATNPPAIFDIEFLGGTAVQVELKPDVKDVTDEQIRNKVAGTGESGRPSGVEWLRAAADELEKGANVQSTGQGEFRLTSKTLTPEQLGALIRAELEREGLERDGLSASGQELIVRTKVDAKLDLDGFRKRLANAAAMARSASQNLAGARVQTVEDVNASGEKLLAFEIVTVETNREMVQNAIVAALGDILQVDRPVNFQVVKDPKIAPDGYFPIEEGDRFMDDVLGEVAPDAHFDIKRYTGGVAMVFDKLDPPLTEDQVQKRIREIRLQPEFENYQWREYLVKGMNPTGGEGDKTTFSRFALAVVDESVPYGEDPRKWEEMLAKPELQQAEQALRSEKSLQKVIQFAPQVAGQARNQAFVALVLSLVGIVAYVWVRFGSMLFGLAAIVALVHDVIIGLAALTIGHYLFGIPPFSALLITDFKIDMPVVAALLTLVGFSINDTIVIFDRIRETRGKSGVLNPNVINTSINQTMSRTILTSGTVILTLFIMYVWGGEGIHGFAFCMLIGAFSGTYSTVAIAAPLLYMPRLLFSIVYVLTAAGLLALIAMMDTNPTAFLVIGAAIVALALFLIVRQYQSQRPSTRGLATA